MIRFYDAISQSKFIAITFICLYSSNIMYIDNGRVKSVDGYYCDCNNDMAYSTRWNVVVGVDSAFTLDSIGICKDSIIKVSYKNSNHNIEDFVVYDTLNNR